MGFVQSYSEKSYWGCYIGSIFLFHIFCTSSFTFSYCCKLCYCARLYSNFYSVPPPNMIVLYNFPASDDTQKSHRSRHRTHKSSGSSHKTMSRSLSCDSQSKGSVTTPRGSTVTNLYTWFCSLCIHAICLVAFFILSWKYCYYGAFILYLFLFFVVRILGVMIHISFWTFFQIWSICFHFSN